MDKFVNFGSSDNSRWIVNLSQISAVKESKNGYTVFYLTGGVEVESTLKFSSVESMLKDDI